MNKEEILKEITESPLSDSSKKKIQKILDATEEVTIDTVSQIRDLIQAEIDADFDSMGVVIDPEDPAIIQASKDFDEGMTHVEEELKEDLDFVQDKMAEIDSLRSKIDKALDQSEIADIKASLPKE